MGVENRQDCKELNLEDGAVFSRFSRWRQPGKPGGNALSILVRLPPGAGLAGGDRRSFYATTFGTPSVLGPAFSLKASVNSCKLETICGALVNTVEASFSA